MKTHLIHVVYRKMIGIIIRHFFGVKFTEFFDFFFFRKKLQTLIAEDTHAYTNFDDRTLAPLYTFFLSQNFNNI